MHHTQYPFLLTCFTNDPLLARQADEAGVDRIGPDLEHIGKDTRQGHLNAWISTHREEDLTALRSSVLRAELFVRTNPPHSRLKEEIRRYMDAGAEVLMLPYFGHEDEAAAFVDAIGGRAKVSLLVETASAASRITHILALDGIHDVHIGLNDLHLSLGMSSHFELLASPFMDRLARTLNDSGIHWGFGGIGRPMDNSLPVASDLVYAQYARLGGRAALISRSFTNSRPYDLDMKTDVALARRRLDFWFNAARPQIDATHSEFRAEIEGVALATTSD